LITSRIGFKPFKYKSNVIVLLDTFGWLGMEIGRLRGY
jgi:hypothetical protein